MSPSPHESGSAASGATPVALVNGAWHGAWCWPLLQHRLAARGIPSTAVEVLGFGGLTGASPAAYRARPFDGVAFATERSAVADLTLDTVRTRLIEDIRAAGGGRPVAVVAHSISAFVVTAAAEAAPELFASLIYLAAIAPLLDLPAAAYNTEPEMAESRLISGLVGDPASLGAARCDFAGNPAWTADVFYHDAEEGLRRQAIGMLSTDVPFGINGSVRVSSAGLASIPRAFIHTTQDRAIPMAMQRRIVREIDRACGGTTETRSVDTSHSPFLSQPGVLADHIVELARLTR